MTALLLLAYGASISLSLFLIAIPLSFFYQQIVKAKVSRKIIEAGLGSTKNIDKLLNALDKGSEEDE